MGDWRKAADARFSMVVDTRGVEGTEVGCRSRLRRSHHRLICGRYGCSWSCEAFGVKEDDGGGCFVYLILIP